MEAKQLKLASMYLWLLASQFCISWHELMSIKPIAVLLLAIPILIHFYAFHYFQMDNETSILA